MKLMNQAIITVFITMFSVGVYAACCAGHGGVKSCNHKTGQQMCKDGTASPSCTCPKKEEKKATKKSSTTEMLTPTSTKPTTDTKKSWWGFGGKKATTSTTDSNKTGSSHSGCCSRHGGVLQNAGVSQCNRSTNRLICNDKTVSPSCPCS